MSLMSAIQPTTSSSRPNDNRALRVGAVAYLNSKPLIEGLAADLTPACENGCRQASGDCSDRVCESICQHSGELTLDYPSRLADDLAAGKLDVALIPSVEALTGDGYQIISDACVAARGPVRSVKLYSRVPAGEIRTLALDEGSRTSAALTRTILAHRYGVEPVLKPFPLNTPTTDCDADALLMIGDRAMNPPDEQFAETWDLGEHWYRWTGRPFVFAVWVAREGVPTAEIAAKLTAARDRGLAAIPSIAARDAARVGTSVEIAETYLKRNLHFRLTAAERASLKQFERLARECQVIGTGSKCV